MSEEVGPTLPTPDPQHRIDPRVLTAVVKIMAESTPHSPSAVGTGFVISREGSWQGSPQRLYFLVTNKHMVGDWTLADGDILEYRPSLQVAFYGGVGGAFTPVTIELPRDRQDSMPSRIRLAADPTVDIASIFLNDIHTPVGPALSINSLDTSFLLPFDRIPAVLTGLGDQVFALGYPLGITSTTTSHPIAKAGYLATVPGNEFAIDIPATGRNSTGTVVHLKGRILVIDGLIVPGNSGGPVVLASELKMRLEPSTGQLQYATRQTQNFAIGIVSMAIGTSGLTLAYGCDYIVDLVNAFAEDLETKTSNPPAA